MGSPWGPHGDPMGPFLPIQSPWCSPNHHGVPMGTPRDHSFPIQSPWCSHGNPMGAFLSHPITMVFPWGNMGPFLSHPITMVFPWDPMGAFLSHPITMVFPWGTWDHSFPIQSPWCSHGDPMGVFFPNQPSYPYGISRSIHFPFCPHHGNPWRPNEGTWRIQKNTPFHPLNNCMEKIPTMVSHDNIMWFQWGCNLTILKPCVMYQESDLKSLWRMGCMYMYIHVTSCFNWNVEILWLTCHYTCTMY